MKKRVIATLMAGAMTASLFGGFSAQAESTDREPITVELLQLDAAASMEGEWEQVKDSAAYKYIQQEFGITFEPVFLDADQTAIRLASGELGDMLLIGAKLENYTTMIENELIIPLNDLITEYAPQMEELYPERWAMMTGSLSDGEGNIYTIPRHQGNAGIGYEVDNWFFTVRWDLYKELGCPEITSMDDYIQLLADMVALQPTTDEGKEVYGVGFYNNPGKISGVSVGLRGVLGYENMYNWMCMYDIQNQKLDYISDENSFFFKCCEIYNKAYRAGILDPDSVIQTTEDLMTKITAGQVIMPDRFLNTTANWEQNELNSNPESNRGYISIPVEGYTVFGNVWQNGWFDNTVAIPSTSRYADRIMEFISWANTYEGARILANGIEGEDWEYNEEGVPVFTDLYYDLKAAGTLSSERGMETYLTYAVKGFQNATIAEDGYEVDLRYGSDYLSRLEKTPWEAEYCEHYGVNYPSEVFKTAIEEGTIYDQSAMDTRIVFGTCEDEDVMRAESMILAEASEQIAKLVFCDTEEAFAEAKALCRDEFIKLGAEDARAYWQAEWDEQWALYNN